MTGNLTAGALAEYSRTDPSLNRILELDLPDGSTRRYCDLVGSTDSVSLGPATPRIRRWGRFRRQLGDWRGSIPGVTGQLLFDDGSREWQSLLGTFGPDRLQYAAARLKVLSPNLTAGDITTVFVGMLESWPKPQRGQYQLVLRTNDLWLRSSITRLQFRATDFPNADPSLFGGTLLPIVYGNHDSNGTGKNGAVKLLKVDGVNGYWFAGLGALKGIPKVYVDADAGTAASSFSFAPVTVNGLTYTRVSSITPTPADGKNVTADVQGYETVGNGSGTLVENPVDQLQHILVNFGYGAGYRGGSAWASVGATPIDTTAFTAAGAYCTAKGMKASRVFGDTAMTVEDVIREYCVTWGLRAYWTFGGKLGVVPRTHILPAAARTWIKWDRDSFQQPSFTVDGVDGYLTSATARICYQDFLANYVAAIEVRNSLIPSSREVAQSFDFRSSYAAVV